MTRESKETCASIATQRFLAENHVIPCCRAREFLSSVCPTILGIVWENETRLYISRVVTHPFSLFFLRYRRRMAGGPFPESCNVHKNKFVEEWNGRREITEMEFKLDAKKVPMVILTCVLIPYFFYAQSRAELLSRGDRRYKDIC